MWASQIRILDMSGGVGGCSTVCLLPLEQNEAAVSLCVVRWAALTDNTPHLVVGVAKDALLSPRSCSEGSLHVYKVLPDTFRVHSIKTHNKIECMYISNDFLY